MKNEELSASQAHFTYDIDRIEKLRASCKMAGIIGQPRALSALQMGMNVETKGYNIYISGEDGTGRHSAVRQIAANLIHKRTICDTAYVYNFKRPQSPFLLVLTSPFGSVLKYNMDVIADYVQENKWSYAITELQLLQHKITDKSQLLDQYFSQVLEAIKAKEGPSDKYRVNLICDNQDKTDCTVIEEYHPTQANLFGQLTSSSQFTHLRLTSGSLLDAVGGFFVVRADKVLAQEGLWEKLKLFAESSSFTISTNNDKEGAFIRPVTSPFSTKVILIGSEEL